MPIPDYQACMLPLLRFSADGQEHQLKEAVHRLASEFSLTDEEKNEFLPSGQQTVFTNRVGWACTYLKKAGLLSSSRRGYFQITERGRSVVQENPPAVNVKYLEKFPEFVQFNSIRKEKSESEESELSLGQTPHEALEAAYERLRSELAAEILSNIKTSDPTLFESIVVELLVKMGYGGSRKDAGRAIAKWRRRHRRHYQRGSPRPR
jgi:restriction system protein